LLSVSRRSIRKTTILTQEKSGTEVPQYSLKDKQLKSTPNIVAESRTAKCALTYVIQIFWESMNLCDYDQISLADFGHTQKDVYEGRHSKGGRCLPPTLLG
jgi:hypothetical protein